MKMHPLTPDEITDAADLFFEAYAIVAKRMPKGSSVEDTLKCMEEVKKIASKLRSDEEKEKREHSLGFAKNFARIYAEI